MCNLQLCGEPGQERGREVVWLEEAHTMSQPMLGQDFSSSQAPGCAEACHCHLHWGRQPGSPAHVGVGAQRDTCSHSLAPGRLYSFLHGLLGSQMPPRSFP